MEQTQKWVNLGLLVAALALFIFFHQLAAAVWDASRLPIPDWPFEPSHLIALLIAAGGALWARRSVKTNTFFNEVAAELTKVSWPNRKETVASAGVVIVMVALASVILFVVDSVWRVMIHRILSF